MLTSVIHKIYRKKVLNMTMAEAIISGNLEAVKKIQLENPSCIDELYNGITLPNLAASTELFSFMPSQQIMLSL